MTYLQAAYKITSTGIWMPYWHKSLNIATRQLPPVGGNSSALAAIPDLDKAMNGTFSMLMVNHIPYHIWAGHTCRLKTKKTNALEFTCSGKIIYTQMKLQYYIQHDETCF